MSWSTAAGAYVPVSGQLAYIGQRYVYYVDPANTSAFSAGQLATIDAIASEHTDRLDDLMGALTDLDGNQRVAVFISSTVYALQAIGGQAHVNPWCDLQPACGGGGEVIYFMPPGTIDPSWAGNASYWVNNYYPRNILHESIHLRQAVHSIRRTGSLSYWNAPYMVSEGLAELSRIETSLGFTDAWGYMRQHFLSKDLTYTPASDPYFTGAILHWWAYRRWGDGYPEAVIDAMYRAVPMGMDIFEAAVGIREPDFLALFYASLYYDDTSFGTAVNLVFNGISVPALLGGVRIPSENLAVGTEISRSIQYTGVRVFTIQHQEPVRLTVSAGSTGASVLVARP